MMDGAGSEDHVPVLDGSGSGNGFAGQGQAFEGSGPADPTSLEALVAQIEQDPWECRQAFEGLESLDVATRVSVIEGLAGIRAGAGVVRLLQLLATSESAETREAALAVQQTLDAGERHALESSGREAGLPDDADAWPTPTVLDVPPAAVREFAIVGHHHRPRLVNCLVTAVDGQGRGSVAISANRHTERCTAIFLCDVEHGVISAVGKVEPESRAAGALLDEARIEAGSMGVEGVPELALGVLAGCLSLSEAAPARPVMEWMRQTLGDFAAQPFPAPAMESRSESIAGAELMQRADEVLRACPSWLDRSPLTFELAEEVCLRESRMAVDPQRNSGAFRFLFEHRIIQRLELYRRMLCWMHWFWSCAGEPDLAASAQILAWQLSDQQFAVPSHPFTVALTARSLDAAPNFWEPTRTPGRHAGGNGLSESRDSSG